MTTMYGNIRGVRVKPNEELRRHTSFRIGGRARYFVFVDSKRALRSVLAATLAQNMPYFVIGSGTNILAADAGFPGTVMKLSGGFRRIVRDSDRFRCGAGVLIDRFLSSATAQGYAGAEFLAGIPGTLGGAVKGNAGAFGHAIGELVTAVRLMDARGAETVLPGADIRFTYRHSDIGDAFVITGVDLRLKKDDRHSIQQRINEYLRIRRQKQPSGYSAGSFFKNPPGHAAGELIEICGLKGMGVGDAEISRKHGNYIMNKGRARAADVMALAERVRRVVLSRTGIELEQEVRLLS